MLNNTYPLFAKSAALTIIDNDQAIGTLNNQNVFAFLSRESNVNQQ